MPPAPPPTGARPAAAKGKTGLIVGIVAAVVLVGGGVGAYLWFNSTGSNLAKYAPKDTHTYMEIPSTTKALVGAIGMDVFDEKELDADKSKDDIIDAFASSFSIEKSEAEDILTGVSGASVASRKIERKDDDFGPSKEDVVLLKMSSAGDVEPLLKSKRFKEEGDLAGGKEYKLYRKEVDEDKAEKLSEFEKAFNGMGDRKEDKEKKDDDDDDGGSKKKKKKEKNREVLVWFESEALFALGNESMVEDVGKIIKDGGDSLKDNENFKKAKWDSGSAAIFFMNPEFADKSEKKDVFNDVGPITGSVKFDDAGLVVNGHAEFKGKKMPKNDDLLAEEVSLTLHEKLPADTLAYVAFSAKWKGDGKAVQKALVKAADGSRDDDDKGKTFEEQLDDMEKNIGFSFDVLLDAVGDEAVIGITADSKVEMESLMKGGKDAAMHAAGHMSLVAIFHVGDKDKAEKLIKTLKDTIEEKGKEAVELKKKDGGFYVEPAENVKALLGDVEVGLQVTIEDDKHILIALGSKKKIDAIKAAFNGEGDTLKDDKAHKKALSAVGDKGQMLFYVDAGRIGKKALEDAGDMKKEMKKKGFNIDSIVLEGDNRVVIAGSGSITFKDELMTVDIRTLNAPILAAAGSLMFLARLGSDMDTPRKKSGGSDFDAPPSTPPSRPAGGGPPPTGMPACDAYLTRMYNCADKMGAGADQIRKSMMDAAAAYKKSAEHPSARTAIEDSCRKAAESVPPMCN